MPEPIHTDRAPPPFSSYAQGVRVPAGHQLLFVSGQVGVGLDGRLAADEPGQHEQAWRNVLAILEADGMSAGDIVDVHAFVTTASGVATFREIRERMLGGVTPASTLLVAR